MKHLSRLVLAAAAACALPFAAQAQGQVAYTAKNVNVRAGPARDYPVVALLPAGYQIIVQGCLADYTWCDVLAGPSRGWVYGGNLNYLYQNTQVPVLTYGAVIGIGVLAFAFNDYWGRHYHDRPWYRDRHRWERHSWADRPAPSPRYDRPSRRPDVTPQPGAFGPRAQQPGAIGPRAPAPQQGLQPRSVVPRSQPANPSGGVLPGPSALPRQGTAADRANPSGGVLPVPSPPPRQQTAPRERPAPQQQPAAGADSGRRSHQGDGGRGSDQPRRQGDGGRGRDQQRQ